MKSRLPKGNTIEERLDLVRGITPLAKWKLRNNVVGLESRVREELKDIPDFRSRVGEPDSDNSIMKRMVAFLSSLPDNLKGER